MDATVDSPGTDDSGPLTYDAGPKDEPKESGARDSGRLDAASSDGQAPVDTGTDDGAALRDSGSTDSGPDRSADASLDAYMDDAGTFACGPTKRCDGATEYCRVASPVVVTNIVLPLDGGKIVETYSCVALPPCDAADECACLKGTGVLQPQSNVVIGNSCSCKNDNGEITLTCTSGIAQSQ